MEDIPSPPASTRSFTSLKKSGRDASTSSSETVSREEQKDESGRPTHAHKGIKARRREEVTGKVSSLCNSDSFFLPCREKLQKTRIVIVFMTVSAWLSIDLRSREWQSELCV